VASLGVGLERLRQLGWTRSGYYDEWHRRFRAVVVLLMVALVVAAIYLRDTKEIFIFCLPVWFGIWLFLLMVVYYFRTLARRAQGMLMGRVTEPSGAELRRLAEAAMAAVWFQHMQAPPPREEGLAKHLLLGTFHVFRLPELNAELMVAQQPDTRDEVEASTMLLGPVTADNVGGIVRLAEALEHCTAVGRAIERGR
jgi:hypothetical protein